LSKQGAESLNNKSGGIYTYHLAINRYETYRTQAFGLYGLDF